MYNKISIFYLPVLVLFVMYSDCSIVFTQLSTNTSEVASAPAFCSVSEEGPQSKNTIISAKDRKSSTRISAKIKPQQSKTFIEHYSEIAQKLVSPKQKKFIIKNFGIGSLALEPYPDKSNQIINQTEISSIESSPTIKVQKGPEAIQDIEESDEDDTDYDPGLVFPVE